MSKYLTSEGWITARIKGKGSAFVKSEVLNFLCAGKVDEYEIAEYKAYKTVVKVIYRKKR
ncbi:MAG: hypothetical protein AAFY91_06660 [Bacteroidota bacterium]